LQFYISAYTTLNELLAVFIYNICGFVKVYKVTENSNLVRNNYNNNNNNNNNYYYYYYYYYSTTSSILDFVICLI